MNGIPDWLKSEVEDYFVVDLNLSPRVILDIGANIGAFALRAHRTWPDAKIICYEPIPTNVVALNQNVDPSWAEVIPRAVRARGDMQEIFIGKDFVTSGFKRGTRQIELVLPVLCMSARQLPNADLVKIDTEGSEVEILDNMNLQPVKAILLEFHSKRDAAKIKTILKPHFKLLHDESHRDIGTMIFKRK